MSLVGTASTERYSPLPADLIQRAAPTPVKLSRSTEPGKVCITELDACCGATPWVGAAMTRCQNGRLSALK